MKIVFVSDQYWPSMSGVSVSIDSFSKEFVKMGHRVFLLAPEYPDTAHYDTKWVGTDIFRFRSNRIPFDDENRLVYRWEKNKVYNVLDSVKPDLIHMHTELALCKIATSYAKNMKIPIVMTAHVNWEVLMTSYTPITHSGFARFYCRNLMGRRYNKADFVIVPTSWMEVLLNLYFVKSPVHIIPTGIVLSDFDNTDQTDWKASIYKSYPGLIDKKILFYAGRLGMEKNITFLMDILRMLLPKHNNLILLIAGNGPAYTELRKYSKKTGIDENVLFTGFVKRELLKNFYAISDVFVFASKVESQGLSVIESMICGTPVVAIGKMGIREVMGGDNGGFMVDDDIEVFAEKTALLLDNDEIHRVKSNEALVHAQKWTSEKFAGKLISLYESLINGKQHEGSQSEKE